MDRSDDDWRSLARATIRILADREEIDPSPSRREQDQWSDYFIGYLAGYVGEDDLKDDELIQRAIDRLEGDSISIEGMRKNYPAPSVAKKTAKPRKAPEIRLGRKV